MWCFLCFNVYHEHPNLHKYRCFFESVHLSHREIAKFYATFCQVRHPLDVASSDDLFNFFDVNNSLYSKRALSSNTSGTDMTFVDFAMSVWNYCSADSDTLHDICFRLYLPKTLDYEDEIRGSDIISMLRDLYGSDYLLKQPKLSAVHKKLVPLFDVPFKLPEFKDFCITHDLLAPAFAVQTRLRIILLGQKFWKKASKIRKLMAHNYEFKNYYRFPFQDAKKYLDLPRSPDAEPQGTSIQNHSRGNDALTLQIMKDNGHDNGRRKSFSDVEEETSSAKALKKQRSPGDHPSLRKRRYSRDGAQQEFDRTTKLEFQKNMDISNYDLNLCKKDVLRIGSGKKLANKANQEKNKKSTGTRRRHSFGGKARVNPTNDDSSTNNQQSPTKPKAKKMNRRMTF